MAIEQVPHVLLIYNDMTTAPGSGVRLFMIPLLAISSKEYKWLIEAHGKVINLDPMCAGLDYVFSAMSEDEDDREEVKKCCNLGIGENPEDYFGRLLVHEYALEIPLFPPLDLSIDMVVSVGFA